MNNLEAEFKNIVVNVMRAYNKEFDEFIHSKPPGTLTDADIIVMNMNVIMSITTNMYYSLKDLLPTTTIDFDYLRATILNNLKDNFEKVKEYEPKQRYMPLTVDHIKEIKEKGFAMVTMPDGTEKKITQQDILGNEEDAKKVLSEAKKEAKNAARTPKIILPGEKSFQRRRK